jgi:hypothetical protein
MTPHHRSRWRAALATLTSVSAASAVAACGSTTPLPKAADFHGPDCQAVSGPVVEVATAARTLAKKPSAVGAVAAIADAQTRLRGLPATTTRSLPEVGSLISDIGLFRLRVDTHSADDGALRDLTASNDRVVHRCGA